MDPRHVNHVGVSSASASRAYRYEDPPFTMPQRIGVGQYALVDHGHPNNFYETLPAFPQPEEYMTNTYWSYPLGSMMNRANFVPQYLNPSFPGDNRSRSHQSQDPIGMFAGASEASTFQNPEGYGPNVPELGFGGGHESNFHSRSMSVHNWGDPPDHLNFSRHTPAFENFPNYGHNPGCYMAGPGGTSINSGVTCGPYPMAGSSRFDVFPVSDGSLQHHIPVPNDGMLSQGRNRKNGDAGYINEDHYGYRCSQGSIAPSNCFKGSQGGWSNKNEVRSSRGSLYTSGLKFANQRYSPRQQQHYKIKTSGHQGKAWHPVVQSSRVQKTTSSHKVWGKLTRTHPSKPSWRRKTNAKPPSSRSEPFSTPVHHITWNGPEPLGEQCPVCEEDLSYAASADISEDYDASENYDPSGPPDFPEVAVLPCGHALHSECLQLITSDKQSRDPPCCLCSNR